MRGPKTESQMLPIIHVWLTVLRTFLVVHRTVRAERPGTSYDIPLTTQVCTAVECRICLFNVCVNCKTVSLIHFHIKDLFEPYLHVVVYFLVFVPRDVRRMTGMREFGGGRYDLADKL